MQHYVELITAARLDERLTVTAATALTVEANSIINSAGELPPGPSVA